MSAHGWWKRAACQGMDFNLFFPNGSQPPAQEALAACQRCPVTAECYEVAVYFKADGVWAGLTEEERRKAERNATRRAQTGARRAGRAA